MSECQFYQIQNTDDKWLFFLANWKTGLTPKINIEVTT